VKASEFLSSTTSREIVRTRLRHETGPGSRSECVNPTRIECSASPVHLEGPRGPSTKPTNRMEGCTRHKVFLSPGYMMCCTQTIAHHVHVRLKCPMGVKTSLLQYVNPKACPLLMRSSHLRQCGLFTPPPFPRKRGPEGAIKCDVGVRSDCCDPAINLEPLLAEGRNSHMHPQVAIAWSGEAFRSCMWHGAAVYVAWPLHQSAAIASTAAQQLQSQGFVTKPCDHSIAALRCGTAARCHCATQPRFVQRPCAVAADPCHMIERLRPTTTIDRNKKVAGLVQAQNRFSVRLLPQSCLQKHTGRRGMMTSTSLRSSTRHGKVGSNMPQAPPMSRSPPRTPPTPESSFPLWTLSHRSLK
jgi:hypothetical protein